MIATEQQQQNERQRVVKFSTLTVREYPRCLGYYHVTSTGGPPISIERFHEKETTYRSIDDFERTEDGTRRKRSMRELMLSSAERDILLSEHGYSFVQKQKAAKQSNITRNQRKQTRKPVVRFIDGVVEQLTTFAETSKIIPILNNSIIR